MLSRSATLDGQEATVQRALSSSCEKPHLSDSPFPATLNKTVVCIVAIALFCDYLLLTSCIPIIPALLGDHFSPVSIGILFASKPFFQFLANPFAGYIVGKWGPHNPLLGGVFLLSLSTFLFAFGVASVLPVTSAYAIMLIARSVQGFASASTMSAGLTLCAITHAEDMRGSAMGAAMGGVALGTLLGPPLGGILGFFVAFWFPFLLVAIMLLVDGTAQMLLLRKHSKEALAQQEASEKGTCGSGEDGKEPDTGLLANELVILSLLSNPKILYVAAVVVVSSAAIGMLEPLIPLLLATEYKQSVLYTGLIFGCATLSYLIFTPFAGMMSDAYPRWMCLLVGLCLLPLGLVSFVWAQSIPLICVSLAITGAGMGWVDTPALPILSDLVQGVKQLGAVYALYDMSVSLGFTLGPTLGPAIQQGLGGGATGFEYTALTVGLLCGCFIPGTFILLRSVQQLSHPRNSTAPSASDSSLISKSFISSNSTRNDGGVPAATSSASSSAGEPARPPSLSSSVERVVNSPAAFENYRSNNTKRAYSKNSSYAVSSDLSASLVGPNDAL